MRIQSNWTTFNGKSVSLDTVDHQHLSNVYWYLRVFYGISDEDLIEVRAKFDQRFNGQILPYRPHAKFQAEIDMLRSKGMLNWDEEINGWGIYMYDKDNIARRIGEIVVAADFRFYSTEEKRTY